MVSSSCVALTILDINLNCTFAGKSDLFKIKRSVVFVRPTSTSPKLTTPGCSSKEIKFKLPVHIPSIFTDERGAHTRGSLKNLAVFFL